MPEVRWTDNFSEDYCYIDGDKMCVKQGFGQIEITYPLQQIVVQLNPKE